MTEHPTSPDGGSAPVGDANPSSPDRSAGSSPSNGPGSLSARPPGQHLPPDQDWWARPSGALSRPGWETSNPETSPRGASAGAEGPAGRNGFRTTAAGATPPAGGPDPSTQVFGPGNHGQAPHPTDRTYDGAYSTPGFRTAAHRTTGFDAADYGAAGYGAAGYGAAGYGGDRATGGAATAALPRAPRRRRSTGLIGGATVLALASAFGAGYLGSQVGTSPTTAAAPDSAVVRSSVSAPAVAQVIPSNGVQTVAQSVLPSVVSVVAVSGQGVAEGSGVILSADGKILTNNHVIAGSQQLTVRLNDGTTARADVVGGDATDDLAVIQAKGLSGLKPATIGSSGNLSVGQEVVAIGSPLGLSSTVTSGIVSALNRPVRTADSQGQQPDPYNQSPQQDPQGNQDPNRTIPAGQDTVLNAIQTDAAINHGNSGGALVDMTGKVIGINSAIASASSGDPSGSGGGNIGIGFAIPIDQAKRIADEIIASGHATHAVLGATVSSASTAEEVMSSGATIASVTSGGAAEKAGLQKGDVVTKVGTQQVESSDALVAAVRSQKPGGTVDVTYVRDKKSHTVSVTLGSAKSQ